MLQLWHPQASKPHEKQFSKTTVGYAGFKTWFLFGQITFPNLNSPLSTM